MLQGWKRTTEGPGYKGRKWEIREAAFEIGLKNRHAIGVSVHSSLTRLKSSQ